MCKGPEARDCLVPLKSNQKPVCAGSMVSQGGGLWGEPRPNGKGLMAQAWAIGCRRPGSHVAQLGFTV